MPSSNRQAIDQLEKAVKSMMKIAQAMNCYTTFACRGAELPAADKGARDGVSDIVACISLLEYVIRLYWSFLTSTMVADVVVVVIGGWAVLIDCACNVVSEEMSRREETDGKSQEEVGVYLYNVIKPYEHHR